jgi:periplasmic divalent cation tolerance protein
MSEPVVVLSTCETFDDARRIATHLVELRLAACVNILPGTTSVYRWKDKTECTSEVTLLIKSNRKLVAEIQREFRTIHPYEVPELVVLSIAGGSGPYLAWLEENLRPAP